MSHKQSNKIVIIMDEDLGMGVTANRAAVLMSGLASKYSEVIGENHRTSDGITVNGFTKVPVAILSRPETVDYHAIIEKTKLLSCDYFIFLKRAQGLRSYEDYSLSISTEEFHNLDIDSILIYGSTKSINKITGNFTALR